MKNKLLSIVLAMACVFFTVVLCSCNSLTEDNSIAGRAGDTIDDMEYDIESDFDDGMGDDDIYDMGTYDDNGVNTNEGGTDGGTRTDIDNGGILFDDGADGVVNY